MLKDEKLLKEKSLLWDLENGGRRAAGARYRVKDRLQGQRTSEFFFFLIALNLYYIVIIISRKHLDIFYLLFAHQHI